MADRWLNDYIEIELKKADEKETLYQRLMKPTLEGDYGFMEDGGNVF